VISKNALPKKVVKKPKTKSTVVAPASAAKVKPVLKNYFDIDKMYKGGTDKWLIVSLMEETNIEENYSCIEYEVVSIFGSDAEYFIPLYKEKVGSKEVCLVLFDGYVFIQEPTGGFDSIDFNKTKATHIKGPLMNGITFSYVKNMDINGFKRELKKKLRGMVPKIGQMVIPREGVFKDLEGKVLSIDKKNMCLIVRFETSSRIVEAPVSIINVDYS